MTTEVASASSPTPEPAPKKKRSLIKIIVKLFVAFVLLVVVGIAVLYFMRNTLVKAGVIRAGKYATAQETSLDLADLQVTAGALQLSKLGIHNPDGYHEAQFLSM